MSELEQVKGLLALYKAAVDEWVLADDILDTDDPLTPGEGEEYEATCERARELSSKAYSAHTKSNLGALK